MNTHPSSRFVFIFAICFIFLIQLQHTGFSADYSDKAQIVIGKTAPDLERYAASELQNYLYRLTGNLLPIRNDVSDIDRPSFIIGQIITNAKIESMLDSGDISVSMNGFGSEEYLLKKTSVNGEDVIVIAGGDNIGTLYGVYGLLDDYYGVGFYFGGDVISGKQRSLYMPDCDETKKPRQRIRGFLPWTNFPQSATVYSLQDYLFIIDQMAKMRMNFLEIHNYNGMSFHNEMFHNFTYNGITSRVFMATAETGHAWAGPAWQVKDYLFGGKELFDDYDFGADCTLHNKSLTNEEAFRKGASMFRKVIDYAHSRGVKIGLGIELDLIPGVYKASPDDPGVVDARVDQIISDYPDLDYLLCYRSEIIAQDKKDMWDNIFNRVYGKIKSEAPQIRLAVSGWGLAADHVSHLPKDVIAAPIAPYSAGFESGSIYPDREYWGCPWLERDFNSSVHYYPYNMHLSDTIDAYDKRNDNMTGFMCLTWRLTDAVDAKMSYIAKAPWDAENKYRSSRAVYYDYAIKNYGSEAAKEIVKIINQNEPYAVNASECEGTPEFSSKDRSADIEKAKLQLSVIRRLRDTADDPGNKHRISMLMDRISAVEAYCQLDQSFNDAKWDDLPARFDEWAKAFTGRVNDISSLGNVVSTQNRFIQVRYLAKEEELRKNSPIMPPAQVEAKGTEKGAIISWKYDVIDIGGFDIYRNGKKISNKTLPSGSRSFTDKSDGEFEYAVVAVSPNGAESNKSVPVICKSGKADNESPEVFVISPPVSHSGTGSIRITARVIDGRSSENLYARIHFRTPNGKWQSKSMTKRVWSVFTADIPSVLVGKDGLEYYISVSDGDNIGYYPKTAPVVNAFTVKAFSADNTLPTAPTGVHANGQMIKWSSSDGDVYWYRIYRSRKSRFKADQSSYLTYVSKETLSFQDIEPDFTGEPLNGKYYYRVTAVDKSLNESAPSADVSVVMIPGTHTSRFLEAENAKLHNAQIYSDPTASEFRGVGFFGEAAGDSITYENIPESKGIKVTYSNDTKKTTRCSLYVNGKDVYTIDFKYTGGWYIYDEIVIDLPVMGSLSFKVDADDLAANGGFCANIDKMELVR